MESEEFRVKIWCARLARTFLIAESLPPGGKVARHAPDEGEMSGRCNKPTRIIAIAARLPLISHLR